MFIGVKPYFNLFSVEGNFSALHENLTGSVIDRGEFAKEKVKFWKDLYTALTGGA